MTTPEPVPRCLGPCPCGASSSPSPSPKKRPNGVFWNGLPPPPRWNTLRCCFTVLATLIFTTDGDSCDATCANVRLSMRASDSCSLDGGGSAGLVSATTTGAACAGVPQFKWT